jgi:hypothetical protein
LHGAPLHALCATTGTLVGIADVDHWDKGEIKSAMGHIDQILGSGIFDPPNAGNPLFRAAFVELLINLRDLMYKAEKYAARISFTDDVTVTQQVNDVTGLIKYVRDALCHPDSDNHYLEKGNIKATFNVIFGKGTLLKMGDFEQSNPHQDDTCFLFGSQRIFLQRHIVRAYEEAKSKLMPLLQNAN